MILTKSSFQLGRKPNTCFQARPLFHKTKSVGTYEGQSSIFGVYTPSLKISSMTAGRFGTNRNLPGNHLAFSPPMDQFQLSLCGVRGNKTLTELFPLHFTAQRLQTKQSKKRQYKCFAMNLSSLSNLMTLARTTLLRKSSVDEVHYSPSDIVVKQNQLQRLLEETIGEEHDSDDSVDSDEYQTCRTVIGETHITRVKTECDQNLII
ncbi:hypothetical protein BLNAU_24888 [Blattamonas nauphoetae]|uniref:Uncharacterized protein n=1 Tax=Blattamonas nauphoetae TaxID=2049346 RepID=A0ABQ9WL75_9EUKA|nr:hypothetical protein BLNAU_24888 [Blattamonas nauphoetae]